MATHTDTAFGLRKANTEPRQPVVLHQLSLEKQNTEPRQPVRVALFMLITVPDAGDTAMHHTEQRETKEHLPLWNLCPTGEGQQVT